MKSNKKKYSLKYHLLEKKELNVYSSDKEEKIIKEVAATLDGFPEIQYDELLKSIKDAIPKGISNIQNFLNNTRISNILSNLGKTKEEVIDDIGNLNNDIEYASEEYTLLDVFNELNESSYEFNLTIPDLVSSKNISLSFPAVLSLLYIINKRTPIKLQETKKHSLKKIIYEEKSPSLTQQIITARSLENFTLGMLQYIKQLNTTRHGTDHVEIIDSLTNNSNKFSTILQKIVKTNVQENKQFFTNMAVDIGYLVEDTMLFSQTGGSGLKPSNPVAKTSLALLMLLKTQGTDGSRITNFRGSDGNWSISFHYRRSSGDFYNSKTFNAIQHGSGISDEDYFSDIDQILIPGSDLNKFDEAINNAKKDVALIFGDTEDNIDVVQVVTSDTSDSTNSPAFDFIFRNKGNKFSFIDLKTSNISSSSSGDIPKLGNNNRNSAIRAIDDLPAINKLEGKPMFLGLIKMIYSLYIQRESGSNHYFNFESYITSYGDVTSSCKHSLEEFKKRKKTTTRTSPPKKYFFLHSNIKEKDITIYKALSKYASEDSREKIQSLEPEQLNKLRNYFESNKNTVSTLENISSEEHIEKIDKYLKDWFDYKEENNKIKITKIKFKFNLKLKLNDIPYFKKSWIEEGIDYLLDTNLDELQDLDKKYKTFFYDSNKIRVIKLFLELLPGWDVMKKEYYEFIKMEHTDVKWNTVKKYKTSVYNRFLSKIAGSSSQTAVFSSSTLKNKLINLLRIKDADGKEKPASAYLKYSDTSIKNHEILKKLDELVIYAEGIENAKSLKAHKEFKGKSLKEIYRNLF